MKKKTRYKLLLQLFASAEAEGEAQAGENTQTDAGPQQSTAAADDEFSELIHGKYKNQFAEKTQAIIDKRFKEFKSLEAYKEKVSPFIERLLESNGLGEGEEERLFELLEASKNDTGKTADSNDKANTFSGNLRKWVSDSETLKKTYPDFDLRAELNNDARFSRLLLGGASVKDAYETVHHDEILSGAMAYTAEVVREQMTRNIEAKGRRPVENGVGSENAVVTGLNVDSLTSKDVLKILKQVENGANISF